MHGSGLHNPWQSAKMEGQAVYLQHVRHARSVLYSHRLDFRVVCPITRPPTSMLLTRDSRNAEIGADKLCRIGLKLPANLPLLIFDVVINVRVSLRASLTAG